MLMNDNEMQDVEPTALPSTPTKSSISGLDQITTSSDEPFQLLLPPVDDGIPVVQFPPAKTEFTSFSELSEFLKSGPMIFEAFTNLYGKS